MSLLKQLLPMYNVELGDLVLYLRTPDNDDHYKEINRRVEIYKKWLSQKDRLIPNLEKSNRSYIRFTTPCTNQIFPDLPGHPSSWGTDNHHFYEIVSYKDTSLYIQFCLSSKNITQEYREICDKFNTFYPAKMKKDNWQWRLSYKTTTVKVNEETTEAEFFAILDSLFDEILAFEKDLEEKMKLR